MPYKRVEVRGRAGCRTGVLRSGMTRSSRYSDADIFAAVATSVSIAEVMRAIGMKPAGGSHFHLSKRIKRLGLDTTHFLGQGRRRVIIQPRMPAEQSSYGGPRIGPGRSRTCSAARSRDRRHYRMRRVRHDRPVAGNAVVLHVDYIDGDAIGPPRRQSSVPLPLLLLADLRQLPDSLVTARRSRRPRLQPQREWWNGRHPAFRAPCRRA